MKPAPVISVLREAVELWMARNAFQHAGALAFYTLFSLAPLVIILVTLVGTVFGAEAARGEISAGISGLIGAQAAEAVEEAVRRSRPEEAGILPTVLGVGALLFGATTVFAQMQSSLNQFLGVVAKPTRSGIFLFVKTRLLSLGMVLIIGFLLLTSLVIGMAIAGVIQYADDWIPVPPVLVAGRSGGLAAHHHIAVRDDVQGAAGCAAPLGRRVARRAAYGHAIRGGSVSHFALSDAGCARVDLRCGRFAGDGVVLGVLLLDDPILRCGRGEGRHTAPRWRRDAQEHRGEDQDGRARRERRSRVEEDRRGGMR